MTWMTLIEMYTVSKISISNKPTGISVLNIKRTILNEINFSLIVYFCLGKYSISLNIFSAQRRQILSKKVQLSFW